MSPELRECIDNCFRCHAVCIEVAGHCLHIGGEHAGLDHQRMLSDCAQACLASAHFMLHRSKFHSEYCRLCAEVCRACAQSCEALAGGDQLMKQCADTCDTCESSCRRMSR